MIHTYYITLMILTAIGTSIMTHFAPYMLVRIKRGFNAIKRITTYKSRSSSLHELTARIDALEQQINNLIEVKYNREKNQTRKIRTEVIKYLNELKND